MQRTSSDHFADNLHDFDETLPSIAERKNLLRSPKRSDDPQMMPTKGENSAKRQKTSEYEAYVSGESSSGQVNVEELGPSTSGNQEQDDKFDFWTDSYASDDDEIPTKQITSLVQSCQRDPEAPALSLINQDLLYLKKGNSGLEKIVLSLHKDISSNFFNMMILKNELPWNKQGLIMLLQRYAMDLTLYIRSSVIWERVHDFQLGIESYQQEIS
ncbi:hypothetical protein Tco_1317213 [Tanacetum coccineum]